MSGSQDTVPAYVSKSTLAHLLDCAESTIDTLVDQGALPKSLRLSSGCVRWCWAEVVMALDSLKPGASVPESDPYLIGVKNVTEIAARRR